ncbi:MAG: hypothetical protein OXC62_00600 [Aestuariivita sp.]|nr:hypothetical protein [Aestuariivita sp.]
MFAFRVTRKRGDVSNEVNRMRNMDRTFLTDDMWERIEPLLLGKATNHDRWFRKAVLWRDISARCSVFYQRMSMVLSWRLMIQLCRHT